MTKSELIKENESLKQKIVELQSALKCNTDFSENLKRIHRIEEENKLLRIIAKQSEFILRKI